MAKRIRRKRVKGWTMPGNTVYVGRPTAWGNPFTVDDYGRQSAVNEFKRWVTQSSNERAVWIREHIYELKGKDLACWCPLDSPCHADVLLELANQE